MTRLLLLFAFCAGIACAQHTVTLTWTAGTGGGTTTGYIVQRGTTTGGPYTQIGTTPSPTQETYVDTSATGNVLSEGTTYYYVVLATGPGGNSPLSPQASATIPFLLPPAPGTLQAVPK
jgi:hypothetical protein